MRGEPVVVEAGVTLHQPEARCVSSRGSCPCITGPWQRGAAYASRRGGVDSDLCLHTGFLVPAAAALAFHARLGSTLIAVAHAGLWILFRRRSESPLLVHQETKRHEKVSCLLGSSRPFPGLPPTRCGALTPSDCVHASNPSPLPEIRLKP